MIEILDTKKGPPGWGVPCLHRSASAQRPMSERAILLSVLMSSELVSDPDGGHDNRQCERPPAHQNHQWAGRSDKRPSVDVDLAGPS